ncbi:hypothetical protein LINPERHAP1_LOCUS25874, partial [Linum perenne]
SQSVFSRIATIKTAYEIWEYLKKEYSGDERIRGMQVLNLIRSFELQRMKDDETTKVYAERLQEIANKVRLLGTEFSDSRIVEKILVTVPEKYEASITTLENTKDLSKITLAELLNALQAQEQRRLMRQETEIEGALAATHIQAEKGNLPPQIAQRESQTSSSAKPIYNTYSTGRGRGFYHQGRGGGYYTQGRGNSFLPGRGGGEYQKRFFSFPPCKYCGKQHSSTRCWRRPDAKCTKCNQLGHETWLCRNDYENSAEEA